MKPLIPGVLLLLAFVLPMFTASAQEIRIVADLHQGEHNSYYEYPRRLLFDHVTTGTRAFFTTSHFEREQLWTSDGTQEGTIMLKDFTNLGELAVSNGVLLFVASTNEHGAELWTSNGTVDGTAMLKDIYPGPGSSAPSNLTDVNGTLYFSANNKTEGRELWKSDGTELGTQLVKDVNSGNASSNVREIVAFNNGLLFVANDGSTGYELWKSDGSSTGTELVSDIFPSGTSSSPVDLTVADGIAFFSARSPIYDRQLFKTDGTQPGTSLVAVIRAGGYNAKIREITAFGDEVFFEATDGVRGSELWKSNGTADGTVPVKDITPGPGSATVDGGNHIEHLTKVGDRLYFIATAQSTRNVWSSDGTSAGTHNLDPDNDFYFTTADPGFIDIDGQAFFIAIRDQQNQVSLVKSDGNSITLVKSEFAYPAIDATYTNSAVAANPEFVEVNGSYHFFTGGKYWQTDGTDEGTVALKDFRWEAGSFPGNFVDLNGTVLFALRESTVLGEPTGVWRTNGTEETTSKIAEILVQEPFERLNDIVVFAGWGDDGEHIYRSDGTPEGTIPLTTNLGNLTSVTASNGLAFFYGWDPAIGHELYKTDGTPEGTSLLKDIHPSESSHPGGFEDVDNTVFFHAITPEHGRELWKSDGTEEGTVMVKDITPGPEGTGFSGLTYFQGYCLFGANDGSGMALWRSDGTAEGTVKISDALSSGILETATTNDYLFFAALNSAGKITLYRATLSSVTALVTFETVNYWNFNILGAQGRKVYITAANGPDVELWSSNGTVAGTHTIYRFRNVENRYAGNAAFRNGILYFSMAGTVWRSDGTSVGTWSLPFSGPGYQFTTVGEYVYFSGETFEYGSEVFVIEPESPSEMSENISTRVSGFPNPFLSTLTLRVDGPENERYYLNILNASGHPVSNEELQYNVDHELGSSWKGGLYFLQIREGDRITTKKVFKREN